VREFIFSCDPINKFVDFAMRTSKYFLKIIRIAHNAKAFDTQFILKYLVEKSKITEESSRMISNESKVIIMTISRTKFIDSSNYHIYLCRFIFGLRDILGKGFFLICLIYCKIKLYWINMLVSIPDARDYSPEQLKFEEHEHFMV